MVDMFLVDGVDPLFQVLCYVFGLLISRWFAVQIVDAPQTLTTPVAEEVPISPPKAEQHQATHIPVWDDPPTVDRGMESEEAKAGCSLEISQVEAADLQEAVTTDEQEAPPLIDLSAVRIFRLRNKDVIRVNDISQSIPATIRRYKLRKKKVVRVADLKAAQLVV